jgi:hypothetical protein
MHTLRCCEHCGHVRYVLDGAWLRWYRQSIGCGLRELSRRSGLSAAYLSDVERGNRPVTYRVQCAYVPTPKQRK